jgi:glucose uptake protein GlcU
MDIQRLLWVVIILFAIAAAGGLLMAGIRILANRNPPAWLAMAHGLLAGAGLTLLLFAAFTVGIANVAAWALALLIIAALGGVYMNLGYQEQRKPLPKPVMIIHALIAAAGFILLIIAAVAQ